jgi:hypothetical protein
MPDSQTLLQILGPEAMSKLISAFGGERIYVPGRIIEPNRDDKIVDTFFNKLKSGSSTMSAYVSASAESGLSVRRVQEIVATHRI